MQLQGKTAFITGGSRGIGLGVARAFSEQGATVVMAARDVEVGMLAEEQVNRDFPQGRAVFLVTDVTDKNCLEERLDEVMSDIGDIDILVNNATPGGGVPTRLEHTDTKSMQNLTEVNYYAPFWAMQKVFPSMKDNNWGRIINMCSLNGINAHRYTVGYNSSKEALRTLTRTAAAEWGVHGITCNVICPAAVTEPWQAYVDWDPEAANKILENIPMRRLRDSEHDIGPLAVFLASDGARYITGNTIHADGGGHINGVPWFFDLPE